MIVYAIDSTGERFNVYQTDSLKNWAFLLKVEEAFANERHPITLNILDENDYNTN